MKSLKSFWFAATLLGALLFNLNPSAHAQTNAYDDAYHYGTYASATWWDYFRTNAPVNFGFGFTPWAVKTNGPGSHGFFTTRNAASPGAALPVISSPTNFVDAPGNDGRAHVWGMFANGTGLNSSVMYRGFSNALDTTVAFKLDWENIGIGSSANNLGGFVLRNGNATNDVTDYITGLRFAFYYVGGGSNSFVFWDGNGVNYIGIPFAANPLSCEFTLKAGETYRFVVKSLTTGSILAILDNQPLTGSGPIESVSLFANQTSGNQNFNRMRIISTSLTPPTIINVAPTNGSIFVDPATANVTFEVGSIASTISGGNVSLTLNGAAQTLAFSSASPTNQMFVTNTTTLQLNTVYNAVIVATDGNGNKSTNTFGFNTFSPNNLCIDAEDYNYESGQFFPNPTPNAYANLNGVPGVDYFEMDPANTNPAVLYRPGDRPQILAVTGDPYDHAGFVGAGATDYELGFTDAAEWQSYTRNFANTNYTIYARAASGGGGTIRIDRLANPTATTVGQPQAALGTCIIPATGGSKIYSGAMIPLTDFFGNIVQIRFPGTNTLRETALNNRAYNLNYLMLVPNTNTTTLKPYLSAGYPYPGATGVALESSISFTIANRQTAVNPGTIQVFLNSNNITSSITLDNNAAGTVVSYVPPTFLSPNASHELRAVFTDNGGSPTTITNTWQFITANSTYTILPPADALAIGSATNPGFALRIYKVEDAAPTTATLANAEAELSGTRTNTGNNLPYINLITGDLLAQNFAETNTLNYDITGLPTGTPAFQSKSAFPFVPAGNPNNNIALETLMYLQLTNGNYIFVVRSDDGFKLSEGPTYTNLTLGLFDGGRGNGTPSVFYVTVLTNGLYPMRLLYYQAGSGGNLEFYSIHNGTPILINDTTNANSIKAFQMITSAAAAVTILNPVHAGSTTTFSFLTQSGLTHYVEYKNDLSDLTWSPLQTVGGNGSITNITDNTASGVQRFYQVRTQ